MTPAAGGPQAPSVPLSGRVVVVTGGNGGIGLGLADGVAEAGAGVAIWARDERKTEAAIERLTARGVDAVGVRCDVTDESDVEAAMASTLRHFGHVDAFFANAGVAAEAAPLVDLSLAAWRSVFAVNVEGAFLCVRAAARHMVERRGGAIVIVSSIVTAYGAPGEAAYGASKSAVVSLARTAAVELARYDIRCNVLRPGWIDTDFIGPGSPFAGQDFERFRDATTRRTPVRRWGEGADLGRVAAYLADPTLTFHTGDVVTVDGGYTNV